MINKINKLSQSEFIKVFANIFENSTWIAEELYEQKPFDNFDELSSKILDIFDNITFSIIGFNKFEHLYKKYPKINFIQSENISKIDYINYDCLILPSYREGLPRVLLEASSMSKPVITTDVSGCKDVVDHQITGLVCEPKNADDLFHAIKNILRMSCKRKEEMGSAGREKIIEKYSNELVIKKYLEFLILN